MDWNAAIEKNREALKRVLAMLVGMAGLRGQFTFFPQNDAAASGLAQAEKSKLSPAPTLPRHLHRAVLRLLRPAEAAARRLIIVAARGIVVALPPARPYTPKLAAIPRTGVGTGIVMPRNVPHPEVRGEAEPRRRLCLPLFDPLPRWGGSKRPAASGVPRICLPGLTEPFPVAGAPAPDDPVDATRLNLRLQALGRALEDLPREARRFARWRVRGRDAAGAQNGKSPDAAGAQNGKSPDAAGAQNRNHGAGPFRRVWPLRPGRPPGGRRRPDHEVHDILNVVHGLAFWALQRPDTS
ncbi:hypothetical protein [Mesorhizobium sp. WSM2239]|uniref:Uncharacterized protein n=2 Tax=unclassified Mesorhizobium TaxID=325217 RepID=A0AAU8DA19_9HYPH